MTQFKKLTTRTVISLTKLSSWKSIKFSCFEVKIARQQIKRKTCVYCCYSCENKFRENFKNMSGHYPEPGKFCVKLKDDQRRTVADVKKKNGKSSGRYLGTISRY